jgi:hypothetical protein
MDVRAVAAPERQAVETGVDRRLVAAASLVRISRDAPQGTIVDSES